jgi:hypothetical protein
VAPFRSLLRILTPATPRLARLRPEYAPLYPELPPGVWIKARDAAAVIVDGVMAGSRLWPGPGPRVLMDEHFMFRGGTGQWIGRSDPEPRMDDS